ncbi:MAG: VOC family protein [Methanospirillum sp.]|uniref:VOC family protein n=1 Tax=Methanospirillum sp. TaxID=45200 RepID=UPI00236D4873|nr:VOC family protein [Methanospirillum sp.]MDD1729621.1 VOC family protein [Methanospirillum sp.]
MMEPRITIITLGVSDLERAVKFYRDGLGWPLSQASAGDIAFFNLVSGIVMALYPRPLLARDACLEDNGGFGGITLAQNVESEEEVETFLSDAVRAGGRIIKPPSRTEWGGYSGYFADPDGHPWEIAYAPFFTLENGVLVLPE